MAFEKAIAKASASLPKTRPCTSPWKWLLQRESRARKAADKAIMSYDRARKAGQPDAELLNQKAEKATLKYFDAEACVMLYHKGLLPVPACKCDTH